MPQLEVFRDTTALARHLPTAAEIDDAPHCELDISALPEIGLLNAPKIDPLEGSEAATRLKSKRFFAMKVLNSVPEILHGIIHPNERVYDPTLGRMLQVNSLLRV